jgi:beta-lactamase regulating signal transducer with metallopeptidase domain
MSWDVLAGLALKSALVAGAGLIVARLLARNAEDRVDILRATVCLLLALPVAAALLPSLNLAVLPAAPPFEPITTPMWSGAVEPVSGVEVSGSLPWPDAIAVILGMWLVGLAVLAGRLALDVAALARWTEEGREVDHGAWRRPLDRLPARRRPRLVSHPRLSGPLSWGVSPGVVLIDKASLADAGAADAVLAHELAHLKRRDWLFLVLSRLALALFWFNPLVWRLSVELAAASEDAADAAALGSVDRQTYARALVRLAAQPAVSAAMPMAASSHDLKKRIACIMSQTRSRRRPLAVALTVAALAGVATPLAALDLSREAWIAPPAPPAPPALPTPPAPPAPPPPPASTAGWSRHVHISDNAESRQLREEARAQAQEARRQAAEAGRQAQEARRQASADAARHQGLARAAQITADQALAHAERAREQAERAREQAAVQMVHARAEMGRGADQMRRGADQMRQEAVRLRDPAYRAEQIAKNRERGSEVTDAELRDLAARLPGQADDLDAQADRLAESARGT